MKKNKTLHLAAILLLLTLASFSGIGSTLAKHISSSSATDGARAAKFGVVAAISGDLFGPAYSGPTANKIVSYSDDGATVRAAHQADKLVAPGTKGGTVTISVTGTPETSTRISFGHVRDAAGKSYALCEPVLKAGSYGVMARYYGTITEESCSRYYSYNNSMASYYRLTSVPAANTAVYQLIDAVTLTEDYYPLVWTVDGVEQASLSAAWETIGERLSAAASSAPNTPQTLNAALSWEWPYHPEHDEQSKKDTILGKMASLVEDDAWKSQNGEVVKLNGYNVGTDVYNRCGGVIPAVASGAANTAWAMFNGSTPAYINDSICAVLSAAFDLTVTIEQVD